MFIAVSLLLATACLVPAAAKPVHKKTVRKAAPTVTYDDKTSGVSFQYPRRYSLKTGEAADKPPIQMLIQKSALVVLLA